MRFFLSSPQRAPFAPHGRRAIKYKNPANKWRVKKLRGFIPPGTEFIVPPFPRHATNIPKIKIVPAYSAFLWPARPVTAVDSAAPAFGFGIWIKAVYKQHKENLVIAIPIALMLISMFGALYAGKVVTENKVFNKTARVKFNPLELVKESESPTHNPAGGLPAQAGGKVMGEQTTGKLQISNNKSPISSNNQIPNAQPSNYYIDQKFDEYTKFLASFLQSPSPHEGRMPEGQERLLYSGIVQNSTGGSTAVIGGNPIVTYAPPIPSAGFGGASLAGFTELSSRNFSSETAVINNSLNVSGASTLSSLTLTGQASLATTTASSLNVSGSSSLSTTTVSGTLTASRFVGDASGLTGITSSQWGASGSNIYYNAGNVGIGTTSAGYLLDVNGTINGTTVRTGSGGIVINGSTVLQNSAGYFNAGAAGGAGINTANSGFTIGSSALYAFGATGQSGVDAGLSRGAAGTIYLGNGTAGDFSGTLIAGNVGIGTTSPLAKLHLLDASGAGNQVVFERGGATNKYSLGVLGSGSTARFFIGNYGEGERLNISSTGNVGIGTTSPSALLTVGSNNQFTVTSAGVVNAKGNINITGASYPYYFMDGNDSGDYLGFVGIGSTRVSGTSQVSLAINGSDKLFINNQGNVGIGTTNPSSLLHVYSSAVNPVTIERSSASGVSLQFKNTSGSWYLGREVGTNFAISQNQDLSSALLVLNTTGNLGIGTTSPAYALDIGAGTNGVSKALRIYSGGGGGDLSTLILQNGNSSGQMEYDANTASWAIKNTYTGGVAGAGNITFTVNNTSEIMRITKSGNVGIGTTGPNYKLEVNGTGSFAGNVRLLNASLYDNGNGFWMNGSALKYTSTGIIGFTNSANANDSASAAFSLGGANKIYVGNGTAGDYTGTLIAGNVGIGTTSPSELLQVQGGNIRISSNNTYGGTQGSIKFSSNGYAYGYSGITGVGNVAGLDQMDLAFYTSNGVSTEKMRILNSGNVGIGTTSPVTKLHVEGTQAASITNAAENLIKVRETSYAEGTTGAAYFGHNAEGKTIIGNTRSTDAGAIAFWTHNGSALGERVRITSLGNVGIGTTSPGSRLEVKSSAYDSTGGIRLTGANSGNYWAWYHADTNSTLALGLNGGNPAMAIKSGGNVGIGTTSPNAKLDVSGKILAAQSSGTTNGGYTFQNDGNYDTGMFSPSDGIIDFYNNDVQKVRINSDGTLRLFAYGAGTLTTDGSGNVTASSDQRLKDIQGSFTRGLSAVLGLEPVTYKWNASSGLDTVLTYAGFTAQNVRARIPEAVGQSPNGYLTLSDRPIQAALVNSVKELNSALGVLASSTEIKMNTLQAAVGNLQNTGSDLSQSTPIVFKSQLYLSGDSVGQARILAGSTSARVKFSKPYEYQPIVTATPRGKAALHMNFRYAITEEDRDGFTIEISEAQTMELDFNYHAFAGEQAKLTVSDGTTQDIVLALPQVAGTSVNNNDANSHEAGQTNGDETNTGQNGQAGPAPDGAAAGGEGSRQESANTQEEAAEKSPALPSPDSIQPEASQEQAGQAESAGETTPLAESASNNESALQETVADPTM